MQNNDLIRQQLIHYFSETRLKNPMYSLRAMARTFNISPSHLSQVLSEKRPITDKFKKKVCGKLGLPTPDGKIQFNFIDDDNFRLVADWYHFAILSLSKVADCKADARWISRRLGIDYFIAKEAFERLQKLGLIKVKNGKFSQIVDPLHTSNDIPSLAIRMHHKQNLELAAQKLEDIDINNREFSSITVATSLKKLPLAKKVIRKFKTELYELLESGTKEHVYTFAMQLFPVSKF